MAEQLRGLWFSKRTGRLSIENFIFVSLQLLKEKRDKNYPGLPVDPRSA
jgi:hypothetical protein